MVSWIVLIDPSHRVRTSRVFDSTLLTHSGSQGLVESVVSFWYQNKIFVFWLLHLTIHVLSVVYDSLDVGVHLYSYGDEVYSIVRQLIN